MSEKRRDGKGRLLQPRERQRSDGMYEFRYFDKTGARRSAYSWKLVATDKVPAGKQCLESLRDMERRIIRDLEDGIDSSMTNQKTLNSLFDDYIETKYELKQYTRANYKYVYDRYVKGVLGYKKIVNINFTDIKKFYIYLITDIGLKPSSIAKVNAVLHSTFAIAVKNNMIRVNPSNEALSELKRGQNWTKSKRHALTISEQSAFIKFCAKSKYKYWLPLFTVLLGTGGRIGEITGLRWEDCDFENNVISISHSLMYSSQEDGTCKFHITSPKTKAGIRVIPMLKEVKRTLLQEYEKQMQTGFNKTEIDGYHGFIFFNRLGNVLSHVFVNQIIVRIIRDYNVQETESANKEQREPVLIPHFSVHILRHTFCTRFCENETNIKVVQEIMGHADIATTMNIYNEATMEKKIESFSNLDGKIKIS